MKTYKVGGWVRDQLLRVTQSDIDWVVVGSTPKEIINLGYHKVGKDFPVFLHPETKEEYALARKEQKIKAGHKGFSFEFTPDVTLKEDLYRRDLTINAMAMDSDGNLFDYYNGECDLDNKILRHVSPAFSEDPLRVLRVCRFTAQLPEFKIAAETMQLMVDMVKNNCLAELSAERIWNELEKALKCAKPTNFIESMKKCGALAKILPEIDNLIDVSQNLIHHPEGCVYTHTLMVLNKACELTNDPIIRFGALIHDVGKAVTPKAELDSHRGHEARGVAVAKELCRRLNVPNKYSKFATRFVEYHGHICGLTSLNSDEIVNLLEKVGAYQTTYGEDNFNRYIIAHTADHQGRTSFENSPPPNAELLTSMWLDTRNINGKQFIGQGYKEGVEIGKMVKKKRMEAIGKLLKPC